MVEAARILKFHEDKDEFSAILKRGTEAYDKCLWNGKCEFYGLH